MRARLNTDVCRPATTSRTCANGTPRSTLFLDTHCSSLSSGAKLKWQACGLLRRQYFKSSSPLRIVTKVACEHAHACRTRATARRRGARRVDARAGARKAWDERTKMGAGGKAWRRTHLIGVKPPYVAAVGFAATPARHVFVPANNV